MLLRLDRQSLAGLIPLAAIVIALAEFLFDHTVPRWQSPTFWLALVATVALLVAVQVLRFGGSRRTSASKPPDISARTVVGNRDLLGGSERTRERDET